MAGTRLGGPRRKAPTLSPSGRASDVRADHDTQQHDHPAARRRRIAGLNTGRRISMHHGKEGGPLPRDSTGRNARQPPRALTDCRLSPPQTRPRHASPLCEHRSPAMARVTRSSRPAQSIEARDARDRKAYRVMATGAADFCSYRFFRVTGCKRAPPRSLWLRYASPAAVGAFLQSGVP